MNLRSFSVRYNESFRKNSRHILNSDDLENLTVLLCDNPFEFYAHTEIDNLYRIEWECDIDGRKSKYWIWYVADVNVKRIEVIAITAQKDEKVPDQIDQDKNRWNIRIVQFLVRLMYKSYRLYQKWSDADSEDPDGMDFGL